MRTVDAHRVENLLQMCGSYHGVIAYDTVISVLHDVPTIEPQQWIPVEEQNPEIDMSYPHSECYLVTYEGGTLDVARWSNVNPFWTDHVTEPRWWGQQFCKVVAWMPLPPSYRERSEND